MSKKKRTVHNTNCCVFMCHSRKHTNRSIHFHCFPKENSGRPQVVNIRGVKEMVDRRKAWTEALLMGKPVTDTMRVCSLHFTPEDYKAGRSSTSMNRPKLKFWAVPSRNLPVQERDEDTATGEEREPDEEPGKQRRSLAACTNEHLDGVSPEQLLVAQSLLKVEIDSDEVDEENSES